MITLHIFILIYILILLINTLQYNYKSIMSQQPTCNYDFRNTICGPFDLQFRKKFLGKKSQFLSVERQKMIKAHLLQTRKNFALSEQNLLPRIKQIEKITKDAKIGKKKKIKLNQYVDGISDLQLYITKKLISQKSTQQIMSKLQQQNNLRNPFSNTGNKVSSKAIQFFSKNDSQLKRYQENTEDQSKKFKTAYNSQKKWVSDKQFGKNFDKFIALRQDNDPYSMKNMMVEQKVQTKDDILHQLSLDKNTLTNIAKKMIHEHNYETQLQQQQEVRQEKVQNQQQEQFLISQKSEKARDINWIMKSCDQFQRKFSIKKQKSKKSIKSKQTK